MARAWQLDNYGPDPSRKHLGGDRWRESSRRVRRLATRYSYCWRPTQRYHVVMEGREKPWPKQRSGLGAVVLAALFMALISNGSIAAQATDHERVEGIVEAIQGPNVVLVRTRDRLVTVDLSALGGVTAAVTRGQKIAAIGTMEKSGEVIHATSLESPTSR